MSEQTPKKSSENALAEILGYTGTLQGTALDAALEEQRTRLFLAGAMVDTVRSSLEREFGTDWPTKWPEFPLVLREVSRIVDDVAGNIEVVALEECALAIAQAEIARAESAEDASHD